MRFERTGEPEFASGPADPQKCPTNFLWFLLHFGTAFSYTLNGQTTSAEYNTYHNTLERPEVSAIYWMNDVNTACTEGGRVGGPQGPRVSWEVEDPWASECF